MTFIQTHEILNRPFMVITKFENQSLFRNSHFLVIFISFLVNILHLQNSVLKRETLVKFYDPYIYAPAWGCISPCQRKASRSKKIQYILAIIWNGAFLRVVPYGSRPEHHSTICFYIFGGPQFKYLYLFPTWNIQGVPVQILQLFSILVNFRGSHSQLKKTPVLTVRQAFKRFLRDYLGIRQTTPPFRNPSFKNKLLGDFLESFQGDSR